MGVVLWEDPWVRGNNRGDDRAEDRKEKKRRRRKSVRREGKQEEREEKKMALCKVILNWLCCLYSVLICPMHYWSLYKTANALHLVHREMISLTLKGTLKVVAMETLRGQLLTNWASAFISVTVQEKFGSHITTPMAQSSINQCLGRGIFLDE